MTISVDKIIDNLATQLQNEVNKFAPKDILFVTGDWHVKVEKMLNVGRCYREQRKSERRQAFKFMLK